MPVTSPQLETILKEKFGLSAFRKGQEDIISLVLEKKDVLAVLPTGGGKSLCYQLPAAALDQLVVVISPLIALMKDQVASLNRMGLAAGCLYSGQTRDEARAVFQNLENSKGFILYLSPERAQKEGFQRWIAGRKIALFAVDEAHCVSQWGHDFREEYAQLDILKKIRPDVPVLALTASATPEVLRDIARTLGLNRPEKRVHGFYRGNLFYQVEKCDGDEEKLAFVQQALSRIPDGRKIIYGGTRKNVEVLAGELSRTFPQVGFYHAGMGAAERTQMQERYQKGEVRILVATNAFGMGIDQPDVRLVIHYQMPSTIDALYQEMGRAGRDTAPANCLMLFAKKDKSLQSYFIRESKAAPEIKNGKWRSLDALTDYIDSSECRHAEILTYYRDSQRIGRCGHCDNCTRDTARLIPRPARAAGAAKGGKPVKRPRDVIADLAPEQQNRFELLKMWRKEKAAEMDQPAFVIFSDQSLRQLAVHCPQTRDALLEVHGVGPAKAEMFGDDVLRMLRMPAQPHGE